MRILHLTPGTGNFHCGSCLRDHALIKALRVRGHDALMAPLYSAAGHGSRVWRTGAAGADRRHLVVFAAEVHLVSQAAEIRPSLAELAGQAAQGRQTHGHDQRQISGRDGPRQPARHRRPPVGRVAEAHRMDSYPGEIRRRLLLQQPAHRPRARDRKGTRHSCRLFAAGRGQLSRHAARSLSRAVLGRHAHQCPQRPPFHRPKPVLRRPHASAPRCRRGADQIIANGIDTTASPPRLRTRTGPPSATSPG
jgi:hypothetical protein